MNKRKNDTSPNSLAMISDLQKSKQQATSQGNGAKKPVRKVFRPNTNITRGGVRNITKDPKDDTSNTKGKTPQNLKASEQTPPASTSLTTHTVPTLVNSNSQHKVSEKIKQVKMHTKKEHLKMVDIRTDKDGSDPGQIKLTAINDRDVPPLDSVDQDSKMATLNMELEYTDDADSVSGSSSIAFNQKDSRQPPIYVKNRSSQELMKIYKDNNIKMCFLIKNTSNNSCMLKTNNIDDFMLTRENLKAMGIEYITFTPKEKKFRSILLKGLHANTSCDEVLHEIKQLKLDQVSIHKVSIFQGKPKSGITFLIQLSADSSTKELTKINFLLHQVIRWEMLHRTEPPQCKRCQRIDHVASNCNMDYRCVKCVDKHEPGQCKLTEKTNASVQCVLCGMTGHPASFRGCTERQRQIDLINNKKNINNRNNINRGSYANITKGSTSAHHQEIAPYTPALHETKNKDIAKAPDNQHNDNNFINNSQESTQHSTTGQHNTLEARNEDHFNERLNIQIETKFNNL
ncbi:hypothetical protein TKK_0002076 [Trichogramma kaykai]